MLTLRFERVTKGINATNDLKACIYNLLNKSLF